MEPGNHYIVVYYAWTDTDKNFPIYEESLGEFIRNCPEIPDWNNSVLEFTKENGEIYKFRGRPTHKFKEFSPYKLMMERASIRMNTIHNCMSLKEELIQNSCTAERIDEIQNLPIRKKNLSEIRNFI